MDVDDNGAADKKGRAKSDISPQKEDVKSGNSDRKAKSHENLVRNKIKTPDHVDRNDQDGSKPGIRMRAKTACRMINGI